MDREPANQEDQEERKDHEDHEDQRRPAAAQRERARQAKQEEAAAGMRSTTTRTAQDADLFAILPGRPAQPVQSAQPAGRTDDGGQSATRADQDGDPHALLLAPPHPRIETGPVELAIEAWLHAKFQRSQSVKTRTAYSTIVREFRAALQVEGLDLDAADPRRCRANLASQLADQSSQVMHVHQAHQTPEAPQAPPAQNTPDTPVARLEELTAARAAAIALVAQAYAARPATSRYGARPVAPTTANLRLAALSSFYTYALRHDVLRGPNPVARVERRRVDAYAAAHPLSYEELRARLAALELSTDAGLRDYALLLVALSTGRRVAELAGMRREHLTIRKRSVVIEWPRCKGNKCMRDELPRGGARGEAADALVAWLDLLTQRTQRTATCANDAPGASDMVLDMVLDMARPLPVTWVAAGVGRAPEQPVWVSLARNGTAGHALSARAIAQLCEKRLGTSKVHALRHTFARALEDAGAKVSEIQAALGHADLGTTGRYLARLRQGENRHLARLSALYGLSGLDQRLDQRLAPDDADEAADSAADGAERAPTPSETPSDLPSRERTSE